MGVKSRGSPPELHSILWIWSPSGVSGIPCVAVKCVDIWENANGEGSLLGVTDAEERKLGYRTGLDTPVVLTVNGVH